MFVQFWWALWINQKSVIGSSYFFLHGEPYELQAIVQPLWYGWKKYSPRTLIHRPFVLLPGVKCTRWRRLLHWRRSGSAAIRGLMRPEYTEWRFSMEAYRRGITFCRYRPAIVWYCILQCDSDSTQTCAPASDTLCNKQKSDVFTKPFHPRSGPVNRSESKWKD